MEQVGSRVENRLELPVSRDRRRCDAHGLANPIWNTVVFGSDLVTQGRAEKLDIASYDWRLTPPTGCAWGRAHRGTTRTQTGGVGYLLSVVEGLKALVADLARWVEEAPARRWCQGVLVLAQQHRSPSPIVPHFNPPCPLCKPPDGGSTLGRMWRGVLVLVVVLAVAGCGSGAETEWPGPPKPLRTNIN